MKASTFQGADSFAGKKAGIVKSIVDRYSDADLCARFLHVLRLGYSEHTDMIALKLREREPRIIAVGGYLGEQGVVSEHIDLGHMFQLTNCAKTSVDAYFSELFRGMQYLLQVPVTADEAAKVLDITRETGGAKTYYQKGVFVKAGELRQLGETVKEKTEEIKALERAWLQAHFGFTHPIVHSGFSHLKESDPYWNDHAGRAEDTKDMFFKVNLDLDGVPGREVMDMDISSISVEFPPYHSVDVSKRTTPLGKAQYDLEVRNPIWLDENFQRPKAEKDTIEEKSALLKSFVESAL